MTTRQPRIIAVGDIHGHADALDALLRRLDPAPGLDTLVFLGDYLNRGPDSRAVVERLADLWRTMPGAVFLEGNHERALMEYARTGDPELLRLLRYMGVEATLDSYGASARDLPELAFMPPEHRAFLQGLKLFHRQGGYLFVHAGVPVGRAPEDCGPTALQTMHTDALAAEPAEGETLVFGHTAMASPLVAPGRIGLDTGPHKGNMLTAVELPALVFHHA